MTGMEPWGTVDMAMMWHVFSRWATVLPQAGSTYLSRYIKTQFAQHLRPEQLDQQVPKQSLPFNLRRFGWIVGRELERQDSVIPVVSVSVGRSADGRPIDTAIRVALLSDRGDRTIHAEGWRFEQAEHPEPPPSTPPAHPYAHAQAITGWDRDVRCLIHLPHAPEDGCLGIDPPEAGEIHDERKRAQVATLVRHPAFPLGVKTATGLALAVVSALYGHRGARKIVEGDRRFRLVAGEVRGDLITLDLEKYT